MTATQAKLIDGYVQKCANDYQSPAILNLKSSMKEVFENNESDDKDTLGIKLGGVVLDSHMVQIQGHQQLAFYQFWTDVADEVKSA